jgi:hypothetical protein
MKSWLELVKQQRARRNGVYLDGIIVPGHEPVPVRAPNTPKGLPAKPTAHRAKAAVTHCGQRSRARVRYRPVCAYLSVVNIRRSGSLLRRADLRQCQCLDTRAAYLDRCCFRISEARSVDHAGVELRNPGPSDVSGSPAPAALLRSPDPARLKKGIACQAGSRHGSGQAGPAIFHESSNAPVQISGAN